MYIYILGVIIYAFVTFYDIAIKLFIYYIH